MYIWRCLRSLCLSRSLQQNLALSVTKTDDLLRRVENLMVPVERFLTGNRHRQSAVKFALPRGGFPVCFILPERRVCGWFIKAEKKTVNQ